MIKKAFSIFKNRDIENNEYKPTIKIQSTVDEGKNLSNIERQVHVYNEIKKLSNKNPLILK